MDVIECRLRHKDGRDVAYQFSVSNLLDDPIAAGVIVSGHDITRRRAVEEHLANLATHDALDRAREPGPPRVVPRRPGRRATCATIRSACSSSISTASSGSTTSTATRSATHCSIAIADRFQDAGAAGRPGRALRWRRVRGRVPRRRSGVDDPVDGRAHRARAGEAGHDRRPLDQHRRERGLRDRARRHHGRGAAGRGRRRDVRGQGGPRRRPRRGSSPGHHGAAQPRRGPAGGMFVGARACGPRRALPADRRPVEPSGGGGRGPGALAASDARLAAARAVPPRRRGRGPVAATSARGSSVARSTSSWSGTGRRRTSASRCR